MTDNLAPDTIQEPHSDEKSEHHIDAPSNLKALEASLQGITSFEKRLEITIHFMEQALAQAGSPHFKDFWEAKKLCLDFFKANISPSIRVPLWTKYSELSREARRLKEIFDEESAFACEQITIAVKAVEDELARFDELLLKAETFEFSSQARSLEAHQEEYKRLQTELTCLNLFATKINGLRKELIKTEIRIRDKNKFFQRLSQLGNAVFPKRKELIREISKLFMDDVEKFIQTTFDHELKTASLFHAREEIKALQSAAKELTLNTEIFAQSRKRLSECWDSIKHLVDEHKKVEHEQRAEHRVHRDELLAALDELKKKYNEKAISEKEAALQLNAFIDHMRKTTLGRQEIQILRECVNEFRSLISQKEWERERSLKSVQEARALQRAASYEALQSKMDDLLKQEENDLLEFLVSSYDTFIKEVAASPFNHQEKTFLEGKLRALSDLILELRKQKVLSLSDKKEKQEEIKALLRELKKRRQEGKNILEQHRKAKGSSGLDIEEAFRVDEIIAEDKERLEKLEAVIKELENET